MRLRKYTPFVLTSADIVSGRFVSQRKSLAGFENATVSILVTGCGVPLVGDGS
jgi:hypothetical protein